MALMVWSSTLESQQELLKELLPPHIDGAVVLKECSSIFWPQRDCASCAWSMQCFGCTETMHVLAVSKFLHLLLCLPLVLSFSIWECTPTQSLLKAEMRQIILTIGLVYYRNSFSSDRVSFLSLRTFKARLDGCLCKIRSSSTTNHPTQSRNHWVESMAPDMHNYQIGLSQRFFLSSLNSVNL